VRLADVLDDLQAALEGVTGLRVFAYWPDSVAPPAALLGWPVSGSYDQTMARGLDRMSVPVTVVVSRADARTARVAVSQYVDGDKSVKDALEGYSSDSWDVLHVSAWEIDVVTIGGIDYLAALFTLTIHG